MPQPLDDAYNAALEDAFEQSLRAPDGDLAELLATLRELTVRAVEVVAQGDGYEDTEQRLDAATEELKEKAAAAVSQAQTRGRERMERAHARGYEEAAATGGAASAVPDWSPTSDVDPYERAPFSGNARLFVQSSIEEEVEYLRQDLKFIRKYVTEDRYAQAVANVLAKGDDDIVQALADRGIDLDAFDADDLKDRAADVFQNTKTIGSSDIRGLLKELEPEEVQRSNPQLWRRIKRNGTDSLPRILDEVAKDLAADSPAVELVSWELSSRHASLRSSPDECDLLARQDLYDFGAGLYHPKTTPSHPHPNCECSIVVVTKPREAWGRTTNERPDAFDIREEEVRETLEGLPGERTITDAHVERVVQHARAVIAETHDNPR
jgi:hypothetical protein